MRQCRFLQKLFEGRVSLLSGLSTPVKNQAKSHAMDLQKTTYGLWAGRGCANDTP